MTDVCVRESIPHQVELDVSPFPTASRPDIESPYDGSEVVFRLMRLETPGSSLMNLGFFLVGGPLATLSLLEDLGRAQMRLVSRSARLLGVSRGQRVLDVACGRGQSSYVLQCLNPNSETVGIDLSERNIEVARTLFARQDGLQYQPGDAMNLNFPDQSFDRVLCLEAAFHFCDRARFIEEAFRVLRPGGRLVVIDFAWTTEADRSHRDDPAIRLVRRIWSWDDFFSVPEYQQVAESAGFQNGAHCDWTNRVTAPIGAQLSCVAALGATAWGRLLLRWKNPLYRSFSPVDFESCRQAAKAHAEVQRRSRYMAFVFEKPATDGDGPG